MFVREGDATRQAIGIGSLTVSQHTKLLQRLVREVTQHHDGVSIPEHNKQHQRLVRKGTQHHEGPPPLEHIMLHQHLVHEGTHNFNILFGLLSFQFFMTTGCASSWLLRKHDITKATGCRASGLRDRRLSCVRPEPWKRKYPVRLVCRSLKGLETG